MNETAGPVIAPRRLLVVGAAAGMGRWLSDNLFSELDWDEVILADTAENADELTAAAASYRCPVITTVKRGDDLVDPVTGARTELARPDCTVCFAVRAGALREVATPIAAQLDPTSSLFATSTSLVAALDVLQSIGAGRQVFGVHALFDSSARSLDGHTVNLVDHGDTATSDWLAAAIRQGGGDVRRATATEHDRTMSYVQTMAHQSLLTFAAAVAQSSADAGLDLSDDIWASRTPVFEALFGLAVRVLEESQQTTIAEIQTALGGQRVGEELRAASLALSPDTQEAGPGEAAPGETMPDVGARIEAIRDHFTGALFDTVRGTAAATVTAAQSKRSELARHRRTGELVGVRPLGRPDGSRPDGLRVGRIVAVDPVELTLDEVMVGPKGRACLLEGPGRRNAARLGLGGKIRSTVFSLGHVELVVGAELEAELDQWLAHLRRDVRFLVPESVAGSGVSEVVGPRPGVRSSELLSEVVRTGQRSVVVRIEVRADHDVDDMVEALRRRVQSAYAWPRGLALPVPDAARPVVYLGPAGTFSEVAASHLAVSVAIEKPRLIPVASFAEVLAATAGGALGVLPISSSASGLVSRSVRALLDHDGELVAGGVADVAVRIDAYARPQYRLEDLRGARVLSHPQALAQCTTFIRRWGLVPEPCESTAQALDRVELADEPALALAGEGNARDPSAAQNDGSTTGLRVVEREVDDLAGSITRFLILGRRDGFAPMVGGSDPTLRSLWVAESLALLTDRLTAGGPAFDEVLTDDAGLCLWVTSRAGDEPEPTAQLRALGRAPWSPRTPVVRVDV